MTALMAALLTGAPDPHSPFFVVGAYRHVSNDMLIPDGQGGQGTFTPSASADFVLNRTSFEQEKSNNHR